MTSQHTIKALLEAIADRSELAELLGGAYRTSDDMAREFEAAHGRHGGYELRLKYIRGPPMTPDTLSSIELRCVPLLGDDPDLLECDHADPSLAESKASPRYMVGGPWPGFGQQGASTR